MAEDLLLDVLTPLDFRVRVTQSRWEVIITAKHPVMRDREEDVRKVLNEPDQIRRSRSDPDVYLFYRQDRPGRWLCAVAKRLNGDGFLITIYPTDAIKAGEQLWIR